MGWTGGAPRSTPASSGGLTQARSPIMPRQSKDTVVILGIDIGKNTFHLVGLNKRGAIVLRQKLSRRQLEARLANLPPCLIGMEAYVGAHHLSRRLKAFGHDARLMPAKYARAFLKGSRTTIAMRRLSPKRCSGLPCASSPPRLPNNSTCKPCTACAPV